MTRRLTAEAVHKAVRNYLYRANHDGGFEQWIEAEQDLLTIGQRLEARQSRVTGLSDYQTEAVKAFYRTRTEFYRNPGARKSRRKGLAKDTRRLQADYYNPDWLRKRAIKLGLHDEHAADETSDVSDAEVAAEAAADKAIAEAMEEEESVIETEANRLP